MPRAPATAFGETLGVDRLEADSVRQRVDSDDRRLEPLSPTNIERCPRRRSHRHAVHDADLIIAESAAVDNDAADVTGLSADQLGR